MKIVLNNFYGLFGLSPLAIKRIAELMGKECYFFKDSHSFPEKYVRQTIEQLEDELSFYVFTVSNPNDYITEDSVDEWTDIFRSILFEPENLERHDPLLVQVVEELGEKANGKYSRLKIVEIPDGVDYVITSTDGSWEIIREKHRIWS